MSAGIIPDLASSAAQESSIDTVPIIMTTSKTRSSSAAPSHVKTTGSFQRNVLIHLYYQNFNAQKRYCKLLNQCL